MHSRYTQQQTRSNSNPELPQITTNKSSNKPLKKKKDLAKGPIENSSELKVKGILHFAQTCSRRLLKLLSCGVAVLVNRGVCCNRGVYP